MKRRLFVHLVGTLLTCTALHATTRADQLEDWWSKVKSVDKWTARSAEGNLRLTARLLIPPDDQLKRLFDEDGTLLGYEFKGKRLPSGYERGSGILTGFELLWDGEKIAIPERFWADLFNLEIVTIDIDQSKFTNRQKMDFENVVAGLDQPRIYRSADGGTALIEWGRAEECDGHSMIRWIVSRKGTVLRHTLTPPHERLLIPPNLLPPDP